MNLYKVKGSLRSNSGCKVRYIIAESEGLAIKKFVEITDSLYHKQIETEFLVKRDEILPTIESGVVAPKPSSPTEEVLSERPADIKEPSSQSVYISGKISGLEYEVYTKSFRDAEKTLLKMGYHKIANPLDFVYPSGKLEWEDYMKVCIRILTECDQIAMLPDWRQSRGAMLEHVVAVKLGLNIIYLH